MSCPAYAQLPFNPSIWNSLALNVLERASELHEHADASNALYCLLRLNVTDEKILDPLVLAAVCSTR